MELYVDQLINTLPILGEGMMGIFLVTGIIVLAVTLLNKTGPEN